MILSETEFKSEIFHFSELYILDHKFQVSLFIFTLNKEKRYIAFRDEKKIIRFHHFAILYSRTKYMIRANSKLCISIS